MNTINFYCCGGCGINLGRNVEQNKEKPSDGFANISNYYVDTSDSNIDKNLIKGDNVYLIEVSDDPNAPRGSGKKRDSNYGVISERINDILLKFKPSTTLNVVIHSGSGGSGSVIGPLLVSELISRNQPVMVCMVGSHGSKIETQNSLRTLESYENIASLKKTPISAMYYENGVNLSRSEVDEKIRVSLILTALVFSGDIKELDDSDLRNFLDYTKVTSFQPRLSFIRIAEGNVTLDKEETVISATSVTDNVTSSEINIPVEYQATGILKKENYEAFEIKRPIHLLNVLGTFNLVANRLKLRIKEFETARSATIDKPIIGDISEDNNGLVF